MEWKWSFEPDEDSEERDRLLSLFQHEGYREYGETIAFHHHLADSSALDKLIMESGYMNKGTVIVPHEQFSQLSKWYHNPEYIIKAAGVKPWQAVKLTYIVQNLNYREKDARKLFQAIKTAGYSIVGRLKKLSTEMDTIQHIKGEDAMNYTTNSSEYEFDFNQMINGRSPDTGFHTVGPETGTTDWLEQQPVGYRRIYNAMANIPKLDGLVRTANWAFINFTPTPEQSKPLWDLYKARKESLFKRETEKLPVARQAHKYFTQAAEFFDDPNIDFNDKKKVFSSFRSKSAKLTRIKDRFSKGVYSHIAKVRNTAWTAMNDLILSQQDSGF